jgi:hypothetical protein
VLERAPREPAANNLSVRNWNKHPVLISKNRMKGEKAERKVIHERTHSISEEFGKLVRDKK